MPRDYTLICEQCGTSFLGWRYQVGVRRFCSRACRYAAMRQTDIERALFARRSIDPLTGCWLWTAGKDKDGYGKVMLARQEWRTHRLSYAHFVGPIPDGLVVCHNCPGGDNPSCFNPAHLFLGSIGDNNRDRAPKDRNAVGERHWKAILTEEQVREIRTLSSSKMRRAEIALRYGVTTHTVKAIVARRLWKHVT